MGAAVALDTEAFAQHNRPSLVGLGVGEGAGRGVQAPHIPEKSASALKCLETSRRLCAPHSSFPQGLPPSTVTRREALAPDPVQGLGVAGPTMAVPSERLGSPRLHARAALC